VRGTQTPHTSNPSSEFNTQISENYGSSGVEQNWHLLLAWLAFTINGLEQGWLAQCKFNVTVWGIMFICGMVLWCAGTIKPGLSLDQLQQI